MLKSPPSGIHQASDRYDTEIRGRFRRTQFSRLASEDLEFLERYLRAEFSINALAEESGLGYVAIRIRLDRIIKSYRILHEGEPRLGRAISST